MTPSIKWGGTALTARPVAPEPELRCAAHATRAAPRTSPLWRPNRKGSRMAAQHRVEDLEAEVDRPRDELATVTGEAAWRDTAAARGER